MSQVEETPECPLCMEPLEVDDLNFFPCTCGYQICRFCWHRIRTDENGLCPACRKAYPENPADFKPLSQEQVVKMKAEKRQKEQQRKQKATESRKHLANVRVVQKNLVFVVGLPIRLADTSMLKKHEYFGKFGRIHKVVINQSTTYAGAMGPSASAYVTYSKCDDALRAIQAVNNISVDTRILKTSLGTTKYCSHFIKSQTCPKPDCMYLHDFGDSEASFTKEEMQQGKHQEYEKKLHEQLLLVGTVERKTASPPQGSKTETWPSLNANGSPPTDSEMKPIPAALPTTTETSLSTTPPLTNNNNNNNQTKNNKRHGKDKPEKQEKGKRKGKEKMAAAVVAVPEAEENGVGLVQVNNQTNSSLIVEDDVMVVNGGSGHSSQSSNIGILNDERKDSVSEDSLRSSPSQSSSSFGNVRPSSPSPSPPLPPIHSYLPPTPPHPQRFTPQSLPTPPPPHFESHDLPIDDELDFDPFQETQKGLADLLEKELQLQQQRATESVLSQQHHQQQQQHQLQQNHVPPNLSYLSGYQPQHLDPVLMNQIHSSQQHRVAPPRGLDRRPLPPPGFSSPLSHSLSHNHSHPLQSPMSMSPMSHQQQQQQQPPSHLDHLYGHGRGLNGTKPQQPYFLQNGLPKLVDWPDSLRNLVHESSHHLTQQPSSSSLHLQDKVSGWNGGNSFADWTALDPAIVSTRPHSHINHMHSPSPYNQLFSQGMNGVNVNNSPMGLGGLGPAGWHQRYQDAYFKTQYNTSVPPPGFSLLHQSGNGLKQGLSSGIETMD